MLPGAISDLTSSLMQMRQAQSLRLAMQDAGQELTTGLKADVKKAAGGDYTELFSIDRSLSRISQQISDLSNASNRADNVQTRLQLLSDLADQSGLRLVAAVETGDIVASGVYANETRAALETVFSTLNGTYAGRSLFSGAAEDTKALANLDQMVSDVSALIDAGPDTASALAAIEDYFFSAGGGFETDIYQGSTLDAPPVEIAEATRLQYLPRADDDAIRSLIQGLVVAATVSGGAGSADRDMQLDLMSEAGTLTFGAKTGLVDLKSALGVAEQKMSEARSFYEAETFSLDLARREIAGVDQYKAAARFASLEGQLQSLYTVTARMSSLTFTNFIR